MIHLFLNKSRKVRVTGPNAEHSLLKLPSHTASINHLYIPLPIFCFWKENWPMFHAIQSEKELCPAFILTLVEVAQTFLIA